MFESFKSTFAPMWGKAPKPGKADGMHALPDDRALAQGAVAVSDKQVLGVAAYDDGLLAA
jgi:hypothetical protein